ncbi:MAG: hypothetical protein GXO61_00905 [Epsilonproteobacteria bacterium]|nr:hypothetical protein [Campylobacterota bacterium]
MVVLIPVKTQEGEASKITTVKDAKTFALVTFKEGMIEHIDFKDSLEGLFFDYAITTSKDDDLDDFYDLGARVLLGFEGMSIQEVGEALMFRELDEIE